MKDYWYCRSCGRAIPEEEMIFPDAEEDAGTICPRCLSRDTFPVRLVRCDYRTSFSLAMLEIGIWLSLGVLATLGAIHLISLW